MSKHFSKYLISILSNYTITLLIVLITGTTCVYSYSNATPYTIINIEHIGSDIPSLIDDSTSSNKSISFLDISHKAVSEWYKSFFRNDTIRINNNDYYLYKTFVKTDGFTLKLLTILVENNRDTNGFIKIDDENNARLSNTHINIIADEWELRSKTDFVSKLRSISIQTNSFDFDFDMVPYPNGEFEYLSINNHSVLLFHELSDIEGYSYPLKKVNTNIYFNNQIVVIDSTFLINYPGLIRFDKNIKGRVIDIESDFITNDSTETITIIRHGILNKRIINDTIIYGSVFGSLHRITGNENILLPLLNKIKGEFDLSNGLSCDIIRMCSYRCVDESEFRNDTISSLNSFMFNKLILYNTAEKDTHYVKVRLSKLSSSNETFEGELKDSTNYDCKCDDYTKSSKQSMDTILVDIKNLRLDFSDKDKIVFPIQHWLAEDGIFRLNITTEYVNSLNTIIQVGHDSFDEDEDCIDDQYWEP